MSRRYIANPGVDASRAPLHLRAQLEGFNAQPVTTPAALDHARALAGETASSNLGAGGALRTLDEKETTIMFKPDTTRPEAAEAGRAAAAAELGRELALSQLSPAQRERLAKRPGSLDQAGTTPASAEATDATEAEALGYQFAAEHLSPEQRERAEAIQQRRSASGL